MLLNHAILNVLGMYGVISYTPDFKVTGRRLFYPLVAHIIISLYLYFKDKSRKGNVYSGLIGETTQQILSGIGMIVFASLHILSYMYFPPVKPELWINLIHFVIDFFLIISIIVHLRVSIPRFLISLGFLEDKYSYKRAKKNVNILMLILLFVLVIGEAIFYIGGIL